MHGNNEEILVKGQFDPPADVVVLKGKEDDDEKGSRVCQRLR